MQAGRTPGACGTLDGLTRAAKLWYPNIGASFTQLFPVFMASTNQRLEVTLDTQLESADLAENIAECFAGAAGFGEEDIHKIGMAVREGVINAYNYGNRQDRTKKIRLSVEF